MRKSINIQLHSIWAETGITQTKTNFQCGMLYEVKICNKTKFYACVRQRARPVLRHQFSISFVFCVRTMYARLKANRNGRLLFIIWLQIYLKRNDCWHLNVHNQCISAYKQTISYRTHHNTYISYINTEHFFRIATPILWLLHSPTIGMRKSIFLSSTQFTALQSIHGEAATTTKISFIANSVLS